MSHEASIIKLLFNERGRVVSYDFLVHTVQDVMCYDVSVVTVLSSADALLFAVQL